MEKLPLYRIRDLARSSGRAVFSIRQLANLTGKSRTVATVYLSRLVEKKMASKLLRGRITFVEDNFVIAAQLVEPSYISLDSALLYHGIITQVTKNVQCVTPKNSINYRRLGIVYHKIPKSLFFGYKREGRAGSYVLVAEPAKALFDGLYLGIYSKKDLIEYLDSEGVRALEGIAERFKGRGSKKLGKVISSLTKTS